MLLLDGKSLAFPALQGLDFVYFTGMILDVVVGSLLVPGYSEEQIWIQCGILSSRGKET